MSIRISIITQNDIFFIPQNIKLLVDDQRINIVSIHVLNTKRSLDNKKLFFFKSFLLAGALKLGIKYVLTKIKIFLRIKGTYSVKSIANLNKIDYSEIENPNNNSFLDSLSKKDLDFIISYSAPEVFKDSLLKIPRFYCLNLHCSYLPDYSGIMPSFWVLLNNEKESGCTVHLMDSKIDNGKIVKQKKVNVENVNSIFEVNKRTKTLGGKIMIESILQVYDGFEKLKENQVLTSNYKSWPNKSQIKLFIRNGKRIY